MPSEDSLDDVGHQSRLRRVELGNLLTVGEPSDAAVDSAVHEVHGLSGVVHQIFLSVSSSGVLAVPDEILVAIRGA
jgi:hypothetical protein